MKNVKLLHRDYESSPMNPWDEQASRVVWTTCRRSIAFDWSDSNKSAVFGHRAHQLLLEIICGLHSPVLGETEVHGQYKQFLDQYKTQLPKKIYGELFSVHLQARAIRDRYLRGLGSQSYGSFARKKLRGQSEVIILGGGHLTRELLPWLVKMPAQLKLWVRSVDKAKTQMSAFSKLIIEDIQAVSKPSGALVIAAPVASKVISTYLDRLSWTPEIVLDFRSEGRQDPLPAEYEALILDEIFNEIKNVKTKMHEQVQQARQNIARLVLEQSQLNEISHRSP